MSTTGAGLVQLAVLLLALAACWRPLGDWMARVFTDARHWRIERGIYRLVRVDPHSEQRWTAYAVAVLAFSFVGVVLLYLLQRLQAVLGADLGRGAVSPSVAFNTAVSFVTNTNWQSYVPETTMGHFVQMAGLTVQNFLSAAVGLAVAVALVRGFLRAGSDRLGNAWVDITRGCVRILLPIAALGAIVLVALGVVMSLKAGIDVTGPDGKASTIALAPAASQESIKELGTNGGGIFNANSAHPFENPNGATDLIEIFLLLLIPVALTRTFGRMVGSVRQGVALLGVMATLWGLLLAVVWIAGGRGGREPRGQGGALRHPVLGAVRGLDDGHVDGCGELAARQLLRVRWWRGPAQHAPQRDDAGRGRHRALLDPGDRDRRRLPGRPHGRADPGIPGQEDRAPGGDLCRRRRAGHARAGAARHRARGGTALDR
jgi:K+-transporting ATPase ATPase A chain